MFTAAIFVLFFCEILKYVQVKKNILSILADGPPGVAFYRSGPAYLPNAGWLSCMRPEIFLQIKFIIF